MSVRAFSSTSRDWRRATRPRLERFYWHNLKPIAALALIFWYTPQYGRAVQHRFGVSIAAQIAAQCRLAFREWVNPRCYYFHEHYRRAGMRFYDFLGGDARYKRGFANAETELLWLEVRHKSPWHFGRRAVSFVQMES